MTNIQVEDVSDVKKRLTFEVPQNKVADLLDSQYKDLRKNVQIKGFRKGKAPLTILRAQFGKQIQEEYEQLKKKKENRLYLLQMKVISLLAQKKRRDATELIVNYIENENYIYTIKDDIKTEIWIYCTYF